MSDEKITDLEFQDPYEYHMRRERREKEGLFGTEIDPETGWRVEYWNVGMTRNAKAENKKLLKVFLDPVPHTVLDQNIPLRGWYKSKFEPKNVRPRPCDTEALLTQPYGGFCHVGCGFCLPGNTLINTPTGPVPLADLCIGDRVLGRENYGVVETTIVATSNRSVDTLYEIELDNGELIEATPEHPFFVNGVRKETRDLVVGDTLEILPHDYEIMPNLWETSPERKKTVREPSMFLESESQSRVESTGHTIRKITQRTGDFRVYDIQTTAENFYLANGVLSSNCYINNGTRGYRGTGLTTVDPSYPEKIGKQIARMRRGAAVYMSSFIDPFLPLEDHYHNTERLTDIVTAVNLPIFYLTRLRVPGWAYDALKKNPHSYMQFSINTPDPDQWRRLSPRAIPLEETIEQVREMHRQGIYVSIQVNPIVPGVTTNEQIVELIHLLGEAGADHLIFKFVESVYPSVPGLVRNIRARFPAEQADAFEALFTQNIGGVRTIQENYRIAALDLYARETAKAGVTMGLCYEYRYAPEINGKSGVSLGRDYLTGDQCHGHRVPVYHRTSGDTPFVPFEACPPGGCLHCAEEHGGEVPCGDAAFGEARAHEAGTYVIPLGDIL